MSNNLTESTIMKMLDWTYEKALDGIPGLDSVYDLASGYLKQDGDLTDQVNSLIRWQNTKAGTSGFISGLGGILTLPISIPANITSVMFVQIRMITAIAHMCGHDVKDDRVKALVYTCLTGNAAKDILKDTGITIGKKLAENGIRSISGQTIKVINQAVGFRLLTKFGEKGVINLGKTLPILGGIIGASFDSVATNTIGNIARDSFIQEVAVSA